MKLEELQHLALAGVRIEIAAADLLQVLKEIAGVAKKPTAEYVTMSAAVSLYHISRRTMAKQISEGLIYAQKIGAKYMVETPATRAARLCAAQ